MKFYSIQEMEKSRLACQSSKILNDREEYIAHTACSLIWTKSSLPVSPFPTSPQPRDLHSDSGIQNNFLLNLTQPTSIAELVHIGNSTQSCAPGHGQLCMRLFRAFLALPVPFPVLRTIQQSLSHHLPTHHGAHRNTRRSFCVLWKWAVGRGDCSQQEIPLIN